MQQPEYFTPEPMEQDWEQEIQSTGHFVRPQFVSDNCKNRTAEMIKEAQQEAEEWETGVVRALTSWEGNPLSPNEQAHLAKARTLKSVYSNIDNAKTLDQSFHEHLEREELNRRNGDQVISRYLARAYFKHHKSLENSKQDEEEDEGKETEDSGFLSPVVSKNDGLDRQPLQQIASLNRLPMPRRQSQYMALQPDDGMTTSNEAAIRQQVLMVQCLRIWKFESRVFHPSLGDGDC